MNAGSSQKSLKVITLATVALFSVNSVSYGQTSFPINLAATENKGSFTIPEHLGNVTEMIPKISSTDSRAPFLIHIQDAHANPEAQKNIAKILGHLRVKQKIKLVFVEGAAGELEARWLKYADDPKLNRKILDRLAEMGELTGSDLFLRSHSKGLKFVGLEDADFYRQEIESLRTVFGMEQSNREWIRSCKNQLLRNASRLNDRDLLTLLRLYLESDGSKESVLKRLAIYDSLSRKYLKRDFRNPLEQRQFPNLVRLLRLQDEEGQVDEQKAREEWGKLKVREASLVKREALKTELDRMFLRDTLHEIRDTNVNPRHLLEKLYAFLYPHGFRFEGYPHFSRYAKHLIFTHELNSEGLGREMKTWLDLLLEGLAKTEDEKRIVMQAKRLRLTSRLLLLELTREEWEEAKRSIVHSPQSMDYRLSTMDRFYRLAETREKVFIENIQKMLSQTGQTRAAVIAGGFHSEALKEHCIKNQWRYGQITPHVEGDSRQNYVRVMLAGPRPPTSLLDVRSSKGFRRARDDTAAPVPYAISDRVARKLGVDVAGRKALIQAISSSRILEADEKVLSLARGLRVPGVIFHAASLGEKDAVSAVPTEDEIKHVIREKYGMEFIGIQVLSGGFAGRFLRGFEPRLVETGRGKFVFHFLTNNRNKARFLVKMIGHLSRKGLPVPILHARQDAVLFQDEDDRYLIERPDGFYALETFLEGKEVLRDEATRNQWKELGRMAARMQNAMESFKPRFVHRWKTRRQLVAEMDLAILAETIDQLKAIYGDTEEVRWVMSRKAEIVETVRREREYLLKNLDGISLRDSFIHADFGFHNVKFGPDGKITAIFDFDLGQADERVAEFHNMVFGTKGQQKAELVLEHVQALLKGYEETLKTPLTEGERIAIWEVLRSRLIEHVYDRIVRHSGPLSFFGNRNQEFFETYKHRLEQLKQFSEKPFEFEMEDSTQASSLGTEDLDQALQKLLSPDREIPGVIPVAVMADRILDSEDAIRIGVLFDRIVGVKPALAQPAANASPTRIPTGILEKKLSSNARFLLRHPEILAKWISHPSQARENDYVIDAAFLPASDGVERERTEAFLEGLIRAGRRVAISYEVGSSHEKSAVGLRRLVPEIRLIGYRDRGRPLGQSRLKGMNNPILLLPAGIPFEFWPDSDWQSRGLELEPSFVRVSGIGISDLVMLVHLVLENDAFRKRLAKGGAFPQMPSELLVNLVQFLNELAAAHRAELSLAQAA